MSVSIINRDDATERLRRAAADKQQGEICMFYHRQFKDICFSTKEIVTDEMKHWRKLRKCSMVEIKEINHRECKINGRQYYTLVVQSPNGEIGLDPTGMGWDDKQFLVDGHIYYFQKKANRDMVYKYVMGVK